jgi:tRNA-splicing endonuclease subunit Sen54
MAHALLTETSPYPRVLITRGHLLDSMGLSVRHPALPGSSKLRTVTELLPEEALYLLERGTLQIWVGREALDEEDVRNEVGMWKEEEYGVGGAVEMSVLEGFGLFLGSDALNWERYQVGYPCYVRAILINRNRLMPT